MKLVIAQLRPLLYLLQLLLTILLAVPFLLLSVQDFMMTLQQQLNKWYKLIVLLNQTLRFMLSISLFTKHTKKATKN